MLLMLSEYWKTKGKWRYPGGKDTPGGAKKGGGILMRICVNVGHTLRGSGCGAIGIKNESVENRKVAIEVIDMLKKYGHEVIESKVDYANSNSEYLKNCVDIANKSKAELFVSIHFNSFNKQAHGVETFIYKNNKKASEVGNRIGNSISALGYKNRGVKDGSGLYVIKHTSMTAVLVECCFIDNKEDMSKYDSKKMAKAICQGILNKPIDETNEVNDVRYRVCVGSFKDKNNAENFLQEAKQKGYESAFIYIN